MKRKELTKYVICTFCKHDFGKAKAVGWFQMTCPECGNELDVNVTKYGVKVERHKRAS